MLDHSQKMSALVCSRFLLLRMLNPWRSIKSTSSINFMLELNQIERIRGKSPCSLLEVKLLPSIIKTSTRISLTSKRFFRPLKTATAWTEDIRKYSHATKRLIDPINYSNVHIVEEPTQSSSASKHTSACIVASDPSTVRNATTHSSKNAT